MSRKVLTDQSIGVGKRVHRTLLEVTERVRVRTNAGYQLRAKAKVNSRKFPRRDFLETTLAARQYPIVLKRFGVQYRRIVDGVAPCTPYGSGLFVGRSALCSWLPLSRGRALIRLRQ